MVDRYEKRRKECFFKKNDIRYIDFKDINILQKFLTDRGKILPRRITGVSAYYQRRLSAAIKKARQAGILSYTTNQA